MPVSRDTTSVLLETLSGSPRAADRLLSLLYDALRERAAALLRRERPGHTLRSTDLVREADLRLASAPVVGPRSRTERTLAVAHARHPARRPLRRSRASP